MGQTRLRFIFLVALLTLAGGAAACGGGGTTIDVTLREFELVPSTSSVGSGEVTFNAKNEGPEDNHELVVIKTDLDAGALPTKEDGSVDESGAGIEVIGEIEEFAPGQTEEKTFMLEAGNYVLICNVVEEHEGQIEAHYTMGMRAAFTVAG